MTVTGKNGVDLVAIGDTMTGTAGAIVSAKIGVK